MEYRYYLYLGAIGLCALLYGLWKLFKAIKNPGFIIPGELILPGGEDEQDNFICIHTGDCLERRGRWRARP